MELMFLTDLLKYSVLTTFCQIPLTKITTFMPSIYSYDNLEYYSPFGPKYLPSNLRKLNPGSWKIYLGPLF